MRVASFLRAQHAPIEFEYPHSGLTINLHGEVLESDIALQGRLAYVVAFAGLHAHADAALDKALDRVNELYGKAFYSIPYYGKVAGTESGGVTEDMTAMAKRYREVFGKKGDKDKEKKK